MEKNKIYSYIPKKMRKKKYIYSLNIFKHISLKVKFIFYLPILEINNTIIGDISEDEDCKSIFHPWGKKTKRHPIRRRCLDRKIDIETKILCSALSECGIPKKCKLSNSFKKFL